MLTDKQLRMLKAAEKVYKVADQQGLYVTVLRTGNISFRYDYRLSGRRETLVIGQYDPSVAAKNPRDLSTLEYGMSLSLAEARLLLSQAKRAIEQGEPPARFCTKPDTTLTGSRSAWRMSSGECALSTTRPSTRSSGERCFKIGPTWSILGSMTGQAL